jgi:hypothetical protein
MTSSAELSAAPIPNRQSARPTIRWLAGLCVAAAVAAYYWVYFLAPRLLGGSDPDRYYHLGLSRIIAERGFPRTLPQVEDLNWGAYFPDKEFLFHVVSGSAWKLGGSTAVLALVPLIGIAIAACLYSELSRRLKPAPSALIVALGMLGTAGFMFRLSLLRPHILAILVFCLLLTAILRDRPRLAALAAAAFALSYHAFYVVGIVIMAAWLVRAQAGFPRRAWTWCAAGLVVGLVVNPYFPSNLGMGLFHLRLALGLDSLPAMEKSPEVFQPGMALLFLGYGFLPISLAITALACWFRRPGPSPERSGLLFLFLVTAVFTILGFKSLRAMEYGVPAGILLVGYATLVFGWRWALAPMLGALLACQAYVGLQFYSQMWRAEPSTAFAAYEHALRQVPAGGRAAKVFNCEWEAGSLILMARPDLRFVDLLEPAFLWSASHNKYMARRGLVQGAFANPREILRDAFDADYVLCSNPSLIRQMERLPSDFQEVPDSQADVVRLFAVRPD